MLDASMFPFCRMGTRPFSIAKRKATVAWARKELKRLRKSCENNRGAAAHAFICRLSMSWDKHRAFIESKVNEFVDAVNGNQLSDVKHHAAQNFGIIYAGACLAINKNILLWDPKCLLESLQTCFLDAMGRVTIPDDPDEKQARIIIKWLHYKGLLKVSHGAKESLDAAIWHGTSPKWPNGEPYRSFEFFSPFGSKTKKTCVT
jgi:hypothetical protein